MEIKIQIEKNLIPEEIIGTEVSEENNIDEIIGEIISYDTITGIAVCEMNDKKENQSMSSFSSESVISSNSVSGNSSYSE